MVYVASQIVPKGLNVHINYSDTDFVVLFISYMPLPISEMVQILGTGENKQHLKLQCIFHYLMRNACHIWVWHHRTYSNKEQENMIQCFYEKLRWRINPQANIGISDEPSPNVVKGCEKFICKLFSAEFSDADKLWWHLFKHLKNQQSIVNLPTPGSI